MTGNEVIILSPLGTPGLSDLLNALLAAGLETKTVFPDQHFFTGTNWVIPSRTSVCIIFAGTLDFLSQIAVAKNLLYKLKVLVIVPSESEKIIKAAHLLRPRLVRVAGGDYADVAESVLKMRRDHSSGVLDAGNSKEADPGIKSL